MAKAKDKPKLKIYISGPMSGYEDLNFPEFHDMQAWLNGSGFIALNPARLPQGLDYSVYMELDLILVKASDALVLLKGHEHSPGARAEKAFAESLGIPCFEVDGLKPSEIEALIKQGVK